MLEVFAIGVVDFIAGSSGGGEIVSDSSWWYCELCLVRV